MLEPEGDKLKVGDSPYREMSKRALQAIPECDRLESSGAAVQNGRASIPVTKYARST